MKGNTAIKKCCHRTYILDMTKGTGAMRHSHWNRCKVFKEFLLACLLVVGSSSGTLPGFHRALLIFLLQNPSRTFPFVWLCFLLLFPLWFKESLSPYLNFYMDLRTKTDKASRSASDGDLALLSFLDHDWWLLLGVMTKRLAFSLTNWNALLSHLYFLGLGLLLCKVSLSLQTCRWL